MVNNFKALANKIVEWKKNPPQPTLGRFDVNRVDTLGDSHTVQDLMSGKKISNWKD